MADNEEIKALLDEGKIKAYGLSNETPYGVCQWAMVAANPLKKWRNCTLHLGCLPARG